MPSGPKRELYSAKEEALWANGVSYQLIKNSGSMFVYITCVCVTCNINPQLGKKVAMFFGFSQLMSMACK